jgi:glucan biosynthesis protein C
LAKPETYATAPLAAEHRIAGFDAARGILMLLGLVIHAADVYMLKPWRVHDAAGSVAFDWINGLIHSFRMEAFFWVAGYFAAIGLARMNATSYLLHRMNRLLLPAVATLFTFNLIEIAVLAWWPTPDSRPMPEWIGHLWFIVDLCFLCVFAAICLRPRGIGFRILSSALTKITTPLALIAVMALLAILPAVVQALIARSGIDLPLLGIEGLRLTGVFEPARLLAYAPYFILGMAVQRLGHVARLFESIHWGWFLPSVVFSTWLWIYGSEDTSWTLTLLAHGLLTMVAVGAVMSLFTALFKSGGGLVAWLADASYPIYLAHQCFIIILATMLCGIDLSAALKFAMVVSGAAILCAGFYAVLLRYAGLHRIFTGRALKRASSSLPPIMTGRAAGVSRTDLRTASSPT